MTYELDTLEPGTFRAWPKIARLNRDMIVTEKIDGTNAAVCVAEDGTVWAQSRTRVITPEADNFGFAAWVEAHAGDLRCLGPGRHFGEWWGSGVQRGYGLPKGEKRFSLFNTGRWTSAFNDGEDADGGEGHRCIEVPACYVVPVLERHTFDQARIDLAVERLRVFGSVAAPGFMPAEGVVVFLTSTRTFLKVTCEGDEESKGAREARLAQEARA